MQITRRYVSNFFGKIVNCDIVRVRYYIFIERLLEIGENLPTALPWKQVRKEPAVKHSVEDNLDFEMIHTAEDKDGIKDDELVLVNNDDLIEDDYVEV